MNSPYGYYGHRYPYPHKRSYPKYKAAVPPPHRARNTSYREYEDYYPYRPTRNYQGYPKYDAPTTKAPPPHQCRRRHSYHEYKDYYPCTSRNYQGYPKNYGYAAPYSVPNYPYQNYGPSTEASSGCGGMFRKSMFAIVGRLIVGVISSFVLGFPIGLI